MQKSSQRKPQANRGRFSARSKPRWWVYVLRCADDTLYTGITTDPDRRLTQHNAGTASKYTRARLPVVMSYREAATSHAAALRREASIKKLSRTAKEELLGAAGKIKRASRSRNPKKSSRLQSAGDRGVRRQ
jgi:putative endonuclease